MILKPWDERTRSAQQLKPLVQGKLSEVTGEQVFVFSLPPLPGSTGGLPVQMVISSPGGYETVFNADGEDQGGGAQERPVHRHRQRPRLQQPGDPGRRSTARKANDLGITMAAIGDTLATHGRRQLRQPLQPERPLLRGDPAGAARRPADAGEPRPVLRQDARRASRCRCRPWSRIETDDRAQRADPATTSSTRRPSRPCRCRASPWARRSTSSSSRRASCCRPISSHAYLSDSRQYVHRGQPARRHLRLRADRDLPGAGGAVREPARPVRDPGQRADVDLRRAAAAVLRARRR